MGPVGYFQDTAFPTLAPSPCFFAWGLLLNLGVFAKLYNGKGIWAFLVKDEDSMLAKQLINFTYAGLCEWMLQDGPSLSDEEMETMRPMLEWAKSQMITKRKEIEV